MLLQFVGILELTIEQWALYGWVAGAIFSFLLLFYFKVRAGVLTWADFNAKYIVNFIINLIVGVSFSLLVFPTWTIPVETWYAVFLLAFGASAGIDQEIIIKILKRIGVYENVWAIFKG